MTKAADRENLVAVKKALAAKYESLAKSASSRVKRRAFGNNAAKYHQQVARLSVVDNEKGKKVPRDADKPRHSDAAKRKK